MLSCIMPWQRLQKEEWGDRLWVGFAESGGGLGVGGTLQAALTAAAMVV
jgi:hypothetical protein